MSTAAPRHLACLDGSEFKLRPRNQQALPLIDAQIKRTLFCLLLTWLAAVALGCFAFSNNIRTPFNHLLHVILSGWWASPLVTWPIVLVWANYGRGNSVGWWRLNRWAFAGFPTAVFVLSGLMGGVFMGLVKLVSSPLDPGASVAPLVGVVAWSFGTALLLLSMVIGLLVGPGRESSV